MLLFIALGLYIRIERYPRKYVKPFGEYPQLRFDFGLLVAVAKKNLRPSFPDNCPEPLAKLVKECWSSNPNDRPPCYMILERLNLMEIEYKANPDVWLIEKC